MTAPALTVAQIDALAHEVAKEFARHARVRGPAISMIDEGDKSSAALFALARQALLGIVALKGSDTAAMLARELVDIVLRVPLPPHHSQVSR